jgi:hypothetical protein
MTYFAYLILLLRLWWLAPLPGSPTEMSWTAARSQPTGRVMGYWSGFV